MDTDYSYGMNLLIWADQGLNAVLAGSCDETLSSRTFRMAQLQRSGDKKGSAWVKFEKVVNWLFWFDSRKDPKGRGHCELAYLVEMRRGHMPRAMARQIVLNEFF